MRRPTLRAALCVFALTAACGLAPIRAAGAVAPSKISVPPLPAVDETTAPGLKLTLESTAGGTPDVRTSRLVGLRVAEESAPSPFLARGAFIATFEGFITQRIKGEYTFSALGNGSLKVTINDQPALDASGDDLAKQPGKPVQLKKGKNAIRVEYASPPSGEAFVRLMWADKTNPPESVPPTLLSHDAADVPLREHDRMRQGRERFANLRCVKCHTGDATTPAAMPELSADTPSLDDVGQRYTQAWLARWINDPRAIRPDTEMPSVFGRRGSTEIDPRAKDIAAYLVETSAKPRATSDAAPAQAVNDGARLFTGLGCVACHVLPDNDSPTELPTKRISLKYVGLKFQPGALVEFLLAPQKLYTWRRMPDFRLSKDEATALVAFLRSRSAPKLEGDVTGDAKRGRELFQSAGCVNCHASKLQSKLKLTPPLAELAKSDWSRGCLAKDAAARGAAPDYGFDDDSRAALLALAAAGFTSLDHDNPGEAAERQVAQLNCLACHARDKQDDSWSQLPAEIDALTKDLPAENEKAESQFTGDQARPPLTWVGEKLRPQWMAQFIAGQLSYKPRPWLRARMPGFGVRGKLIAEGLAASHGSPAVAPTQAEPNPQLASVGRKLIGKAGGFACIQCHGVADQKPLAPFEAPAINFAHVSERLNRDYYDRWVYNPQRVLPGTRMPQFADLEGKTALKDTFGGDARKQFDAIWNFLLQGEKVTPP